MTHAIPKIRIQIETECAECEGSGKVTGLREENNHASAYETECDSCDGSGWQTEYISLNELKEILESGE